MGNNRVQDSEAREQLRPCPFCGGEANIYQMHFCGTTYTCECSDCGIETKPMDTEAEAIEAWNRRAEPERKSMVWKPAKGRPAYEKGICNCGYVLSVLQRDFVYCPECGAKLEWSD